MTIEDRIRRHLEESTAGLTAPGRLEEVMAEGRRRRIRRGTFSVLGAAAMIAAVVAVAPLVMTGQSPGRSEPSVATQPDSPPPSEPPVTVATPNIVPNGIVTLSSGTVRVLDQTGSPVAELELGEARTVYPDQTGGLVYGTNSAIQRLAGGETSTLAEGGVAIGPGVSTGGNPLFYYLTDGPTPRVMAVDLVTGEQTEVTRLAEGEDVTAGGSRLAVMDRSGNCPTLRLVDIEAGEIPSPLGGDCLPLAAGVSVSTNGRYLGVLVGDDFRAMVIDSGQTVIERPFPGAYMVTAGPGGWVIRTSSETVLLAHSGESWSLPAVGQQDWAIPYARDLTLEGAGSPDTTQGPDPTTPDEETEAGACAPSGSELASQDLPAPVAAARQQLWNLASACDAGGLAEVARSDETTLSFGDVDPDTYFEQAGEDTMTILAQLLATRPAHDPAANLWAWPAIQVDPADEASWAEVAEIMDPDLVDQMRQGGSYLGYRVGISDDGRWLYFVGGD